VFDAYHHRIHPDAANLDLTTAMRAAVATWPAGVRPKVHLSSLRTMLEPDKPPPARPGAGRRRAASTIARFPRLENHADLVTPWDLERVVAASPGPIDVMLEAKAKDLGLLWLRSANARLLPRLAAAEERAADLSASVEEEHHPTRTAERPPRA
jgi:UV DNA damage endonuclease